MIDTKLGAWGPPGAPLQVEYSLVAMEEIRQNVAEGFQKFSRGGIEVGGMLYGTREGGVTRILAVREIACEHLMGPSFHLSSGDKLLLREQLERDRADERLAGFVPVGWYVSHTRGEINLTPSDLDLYAEFFTEPWQACLVVKPERAGIMRAGFFGREPDGTVIAAKSYLDFNLPDRVAGGLDRPPRERTPVREHRPLPYENLPIPKALAQDDALRQPGDSHRPDLAARDAPAPDAPAPDSPRPKYDAPLFGQYDTSTPKYQPHPEQPRSRSWIWIAVVVLAFGVAAVFGLRYFGPQLNREPIALTVLEKDGQLQVQWNHSSRTVTDATSGTLEIVDGADSRNVPLSPADLAKGSFTYARKSGDVQIRLEVRDSGGASSQEASRFLGAAPEHGDASEADVLKLEHDSLQDEVTRLRTQNAMQAARIQQLERTLTILQTRLDVSAGQR